MILDSYNRNAGLGLDLPSMMNEPLASNFEEWLHSGKYNTSDIQSLLSGLTISEILKDTLYRSNSPVAKKLKNAMRDAALENDWEPDTLQNYFVCNVLKDNTVPVSSCRAFIDFLANYYYEDLDDSSPLFKKSIIPEDVYKAIMLEAASRDNAISNGFNIGNLDGKTILSVASWYQDIFGKTTMKVDIFNAKKNKTDTYTVTMTEPILLK